MKRKKRRPIDLARARAALQALDALARHNPEAFESRGGDVRAWEEALAGLQPAEGAERMTRKNKTEKKATPFLSVAVRLPEDTVSAVDDVRAELEKKTPGMTVTRSDSIRILVTESLIARGKLGAR